MDFRQYQETAKTTAGHHPDGRMALLNWTLGLCGEAGELANLIKKAIFHDHDFDVKPLAKELGDTLWYLAMIANELHISLEAVARINLEKLAQRYPAGFDPERSRKRDLPAAIWGVFGDRADHDAAHATAKAEAVAEQEAKRQRECDDCIADTYTGASTR